ncbi:MAG: hypothetical protein A2832_01925 [Candidatus Zambryskibacteria bacterium RIFCSPHIGHO2_01_FULL_44_22b]|uniref:Uncharacterized protein n=2 Tax=Candidatus Zambryskiibacteriota TaxID=1817925 RepID=A0A1G2SXW1_9BACT|nr:MAG: hypothetical protein A2832_01925 [Candidatus Zambryskibacteria bacterium RIFCSPHIGHO2_01_FULL_44_22b]OHB04904.1 MAG: hypothetical protein A3B16_01690 [Candidatus Zambryskibacteria bacterium RIFCSPLOWO2_01_FULL_45_43]
MKKTFIASLLSLTIFFAIGSALVFAQAAGNPGSASGGNPPPPPITLDNPFKGGDSLFALLQSVIKDILLPIGGVLCVLAFIYAGFLYVTAQGNETKISTAHKALLYAAIGTALLLGAWVFSGAICRTIELISNAEGRFCPPA